MESLARLMMDASGQRFVTLLTDRASRSKDPRRASAELNHLLGTLGLPSFMSRSERALLSVARVAWHVAPTLVQQGLLSRLQRETASVILSADEHALREHLAKRAAENVAVNVNHLGEAVLSESEAQERVAHYCALLARPEVRTISVKVSSICSQLPLLAWEQTLQRLEPRLRAIYETAQLHGRDKAKLVYLDMESYRDLHLTLALFQRVLSADDMMSVTAGVVLQAYVPDSLELLRELLAWAVERRARGGAPIRVRIVKGANLAHERVESSLRGWPIPTFATKAETDAHYKRMVRLACQPQYADSVTLGIASHNTFDIAYAAALSHSRAVESSVGFELLEGMANPLMRALTSIVGNVLVYTPVVEPHEMQSAIAYLIRRLDENTAPENFLRHSFSLRANQGEWLRQEERFLVSITDADTPEPIRFRTQDRNTPQSTDRGSEFQNEPDTDFGLAHNRAWITSHLETTLARSTFEVPFQVAGEDTLGVHLADGFDPSRPGIIPFRFGLADEAAIERALATARAGAAMWSGTSVDERDELLWKAANALRAQRGELTAAMVLDAGKAVVEADAEVSEAIDFADYYRRSARELAQRDDVTCVPRGVVLVTPPWNFPLAIPAGGVLAALATGNAVILKPTLETVWVARLLCEALWRAGVPRHVLQLVVCEDELGSRLITDARVDAVVLTGSTQTARLFRRLRSRLTLFAETGGKNAIVMSAMSDWDLAIRDVVHSAFGHSGQKCSAASLLICEAEVYDSPLFRQRLRDAAASLPAGSAWSPESIVTPLVQNPQEPQGALLRGLTQLDDGETWLLKPERDAENPRLWSPGIRWGVVAGSFCYSTELFGPVLSVLRADNLDHAVQLANGTAYGLTSGLFSLNETEQQRWAQHVDAGNLYINRGTTGAIVRRQPFGGTKASSFGPGAKAGGPNYVAQFTRQTSRLDQHDYAKAWQDGFSVRRDASQVLGQDNVLDYVPCPGLCVLVTRGASPDDVSHVLDALEVVGARAEFATLGAPDACVEAIRRAQQQYTDHDTERLVAHLRAKRFRRIRVLGDLPDSIVVAVETLDAHLECSPVSKSGRVELLHYLRERSLSATTHRYGNLTRL